MTTDDERIKALLDQAVLNAQPEPCILCRTLTKNRAIFTPGNSQEFGAPAGKTRIIAYAQCEKHPPTVATAEQAEAILRREYTRQA